MKKFKSNQMNSFFYKKNINVDIDEETQTINEEGEVSNGSVIQIKMQLATKNLFNFV